jgi:glycosyltransferase involved in cell wall biosynthesis
MSAAPKVSVVMASYNMARYLPAAIDSVLSQDYPDFEFVLLDDGSTDDTTDVVRRYGESLRYYYQPNAGVARACSRAMELARGEYLQLLDADDALRPGALRRNAAMLDKHPSAALAYSEALVIDENGRAIGKRAAPAWIARAGLVPSEAAFRELLRGCHITNSTVMIRRSILETIPSFQAEAVPGEDWDLWMRIAAEHDLAYTPEPLACYRVHGESITSGYTVEAVADSHFRTIDRLFYEPDFRYKHLRSYAYACVERTVARVAARLRDRMQFTGYFADALRRCPQLAFEYETFAVAAEGAKTLLPQPLIAAGRTVKRGFSTKWSAAHE